jgi:hypothetical protein
VANGVATSVKFIGDAYPRTMLALGSIPKWRQSGLLFARFTTNEIYPADRCTSAEAAVSGMDVRANEGAGILIFAIAHETQVTVSLVSRTRNTSLA